MSGVEEKPPLRVVYLADTTIDVRNLEGLASRAQITAVTATHLGGRLANRWPPDPRFGIRHVTLAGGRLGFVLRAALWVRRRRNEVDAVVVLDNLTAALAATISRSIGGPPVVLQVARPTLDYVECRRGTEGLLVFTLRRWLARAMVEWNEPRADAIGAVSEYCATQCLGRNPVTRFIPFYGVDTDVFRPMSDRRSARKLLDLPQDEPIVMWRSRIGPEKDPETFLRAIALLRGEGRMLHAVYMGGEHAAFRVLADRLGVEVIARAPSCFNEIPTWYRAADVDVQTSRSEGLGISPLESIACGTPVVVSDVGGLPEVVNGGRAGLLVPAGDDAATAHAIARLLDDPELGRALVEAGQAWVRTRFGADDAFDAWIELAKIAAERRHQRHASR